MKTENQSHNLLILKSQYFETIKNRCQSQVFSLSSNFTKACFSYLLTFLMILLISTNAKAQRVVDMSQYSQAYYDSIRVQVFDTTNINYTIHAFRLTRDDNIIIDGKFNEPAWSKAEHKGDFIEKEPYPLIPTSDETEFAILYDDENLYVGVWCWDEQPDKIVAYLAPRGTYGADNLQLFLDSYNDKRTGYKFVISPTGVQGDELRYDDVKRDRNWNGIWYSEGSVDDKGWYAEIKIPFFNLRYSQ